MSPEEAGASPFFSNISVALRRHGDTTAPTVHDTPQLESGAVSPAQVYQPHFQLEKLKSSQEVAGKHPGDTMNWCFLVECSALCTLLEYLWEGV